MTIKFKTIKVCAENQATIEAALKAVNANRTEHTYTDFVEVDAMATRAEEELSSLSLPIKMRPGARWDETSGASVPSKYRYTRDATSISLERRPAGWYIVGISAARIYQRGGGPGILTLTVSQSTEVTKRFRSQFRVAA